MLFVTLLVMLGVVAVDILGLIESGIYTTQLAGTVSSKRVEPQKEGNDHYYIQVQGREFFVDDNIFFWVSEGEEVMVTFGKHLKTVVEVRKLGAGTIPADIEA